MLHIIVFAILSIIVESLYNKFNSSVVKKTFPDQIFYSIPWIVFYIISQAFPNPRKSFIIFTVLNFLLAMAIGIFIIAVGYSKPPQPFTLKKLLFTPLTVFTFVAIPLTLFYATSLIVKRSPL